MIYFVVKNSTLGSAILRGHQLSTELNKHGIDTKVIDYSQIDSSTINSIFIWVKEIDYKLVSALTGNHHIYDVVDNYLYNYNYINQLLNNNIFNSLIVNNSYMKESIRSKTMFSGNIYTIPHHWDPRIQNIQTNNLKQIIFGFLGSIASLKHTDNFLHYKQLVDKYPVEFIDSESGKNCTELIKNKKTIPIERDVDAMSKLNINFNCHLSIRENDTNVSRYKTTAKIATASAMAHNIITTYEKSTQDFLPDDYPFILKDTNLNTIEQMFNIVIDDYVNGKQLWNQGLLMMKDIKSKLSIDKIISIYIDMINELTA